MFWITSKTEMRLTLNEITSQSLYVLDMPSVLCRCSLGGRKGIRPVKN